MRIPNFNFVAQFGEKIGEVQHFFEVKKEKIPISPLLIDLGVDFLICYTTSDFLSIDLKRGKVCVFDPSAFPSQIGV